MTKSQGVACLAFSWSRFAGPFTCNPETLGMKTPNEHFSEWSTQGNKLARVAAVSSRFGKGLLLKADAEPFHMFGLGEVFIRRRSTSL